MKNTQIPGQLSFSMDGSIVEDKIARGEKKVCWVFEGSIQRFGKSVKENVYAETYAVSESKAASNFLYRFKKALKLSRAAKLELCGSLYQK